MKPTAAPPGRPSSGAPITTKRARHDLRVADLETSAAASREADRPRHAPALRPDHRPEDGDVPGEVDGSTLRAEFGVLRLPIRLLREPLGHRAPMLQTLGGVIKLAGRNGETFRRHQFIAEAAGVPLGSARRHLRWLIAEGLLVAERSSERATLTYRLAHPSAWFFAAGFLPLPSYALGLDSWPARLVLACILYRDGLAAGDKRNSANFVTHSEFERFTGLARRSIQRAIVWLKAEGWVNCYREPTADRTQYHLVHPDHRRPKRPRRKREVGDGVITREATG